ncbi:capsular biosynthesis protein [uncultured Sphingomonas sp.]|uniref:capsule biosynthesis protein n=1 Tax=uncultured Sphingomonas sp. TaxID=158754 RepID=UPI0025E232EE|nr:capsular biosynthesis protein [uncultured Sphingomonas sp.]
MPQRSFLFLQGLAGPFFSKLGQALARDGHAVHRINLNGGDKIYWRGRAVDYRGTLKGWPAFLTRTIEQAGVTDIVLFGDCRPLHQAAIAVARARGVQIHVFEEGYVRPDFVTLEDGGVNGHSALSRDPDHYLAAARALPPLPDVQPPVPSSFGRRVREDLIYNFASLALAPLFPGYRTHRPWHILHEYAGWAFRLMRRGPERLRSAETLSRLDATGRPYFVFPLQLDCDYQIRVHSHFKGMQPAIEQVLGSFVRNAPAEALLVVKGHPLDNGLVDWEKRVTQVAAKLGASDRILFLESVDIDSLVRRSRGLVTVNSTTGTLSLRYGVPTIVLGDAVYDMPRMTDQNGLDHFWDQPTPPEAEVFAAYRRVLIDTCLINGGYFSDQALDMLVAGAAARLEASPAPAAVVRIATTPRRAAAATAIPARG